MASSGSGNAAFYAKVGRMVRKEEPVDENWLRHAIRKFPTDPYFLTFLAAHSAETNRPVEAESLLEKAVVILETKVATGDASAAEELEKVRKDLEELRAPA